MEIKHAEYWNIKESKTRQLLRIATAAVSGEPPKMGEHRELQVSLTAAYAAVRRCCPGSWAAASQSPPLNQASPSR